MIVHSAAQSSTWTLLKVLFAIGHMHLNNVWYNKANSLVGESYLTIIASKLEKFGIKVHFVCKRKKWLYGYIINFFTSSHQLGISARQQLALISVSWVSWEDRQQGYQNRLWTRKQNANKTISDCSPLHFVNALWIYSGLEGACQLNIKLQSSLRCQHCSVQIQSVFC